MIEPGRATELEASAADDAQLDAPAQALHEVPPLVLQPGAAAPEAARYHVGELVRYHDRAFVAHAYAALARRPPTAAELARTLEDLRGGRRSKTQIIEALLAQTDAPVQVEGLPSPTLRRLARWPLVGPLLRVVRALVRLPLLLEHQQQFEAYAAGQQQRTADHVNGVLAPLLADALEGVSMLADALAETQARLSQRLEELQRAQAELRQAQDELRDGLRDELRDELRRAQGESRQAQAESRQAQEEFLVQEQRVIVETQKVALADMQARMRALAAEQEARRAELNEELHRLRALVETLRADARPSAAEVERA